MDVTVEADLQVEDAGAVRPLRVSDLHEFPYAVRLDEETPGTMYVGEADPGTAEGTAGWRIKRVTTVPDLAVTWASGNRAFDKAWTGREGLTYI